MKEKRGIRLGERKGDRKVLHKYREKNLHQRQKFIRDNRIIYFSCYQWVFPASWRAPSPYMLLRLQTVSAFWHFPSPRRHVRFITLWGWALKHFLISVWCGVYLDPCSRCMPDPRRPGSRLIPIGSGGRGGVSSNVCTRFQSSSACKSISHVRGQQRSSAGWETRREKCVPWACGFAHTPHALIEAVLSLPLPNLI